MSSAVAPDREVPSQQSEAARAAAVTRLTLTSFRNYQSLRLSTDRRPVVITGVNGVGKTNLLEALSFLAPGRGLRGAALGLIGRREVGASTPGSDWAVAATVEVPEGRVEIGTGLAGAANDSGEVHSSKRVVHIDGLRHRGQAVLARHLGVVWLTPAMDRLFLDPPSSRRRFLDRLTIAFDPDHAGRTAAYDRALRQRMRLLRDGGGDAAWFNALEDTLARYGAAIAAARRHLLDRLNAALTEARGPFPSARLTLIGAVDRWLDERPSIEVEDRLRASLAQGRTESGAAEPGPHRSELAVTFLSDGHPSHGQAAATCSTGEQKALLIAIVLAHARLQATRRGHAPLLLLDEIGAHLDRDRRAGLFEAVLGLGAQAWMTGTDPALFEKMGAQAQHFSFKKGVPGPQKIEGFL